MEGLQDSRRKGQMWVGGGMWVEGKEAPAGKKRKPAGKKSSQQNTYSHA